MTQRNLVFSVRVAQKEDFATDNGLPIYNVPYFYLRSDGSLDHKMYIFNKETNLETFRQLYGLGQVYVLNDEKEIPIRSYNSIDWDLVEKELEYELNQLQQLKTA